MLLVTMRYVVFLTKLIIFGFMQKNYDLCSISDPIEMSYVIVYLKKIIQNSKCKLSGHLKRYFLLSKKSVYSLCCEPFQFLLILAQQIELAFAWERFLSVAFYASPVELATT